MYLLHTLLKDKGICLQDEWKLYVTHPAGQVQYWNIFVLWSENFKFWFDQIWQIHFLMLWTTDPMNSLLYCIEVHQMYPD